MLSRTKFSIKSTCKISAIFDELKIFEFLRKSNITKSKGVSVTTTFQLIFFLAFQSKNWFQQLNSKNKCSLPGKDIVYRFLSSPTYNWRKFLALLSCHLISLIDVLTNEKRIKCFIVDDTPYERNRSKKVELSSKFYDHVSHTYKRGFHKLTLGWSDGASFVPIDFALVATVKRIFCPIKDTVDKRTNGYKRRLDAMKSKPELLMEMLSNALDKGIYADYVLMDSWFTSGKLIKDITELGIQVIGMVKNTPKVYYVFRANHYTLEQLYQWSLKYHPYGKGKGIISSIIVKTKQEQDIKIVFVRNRNNKDKWLAIASSETTLSDEEIVRIYGYRWDIEVFFKFIKSELRLEKEFQVQNFDSIIAHTTIVYTRYILLSWERRQNMDPKTLGALFRMNCEDIAEIEFKEVISQLLELIDKIRELVDASLCQAIDAMLSAWKSTLPVWFMKELSMIIV